MATASALGNILLDKEILLESGTNELELLVFDVADYTFGINVAKVREVLPRMGITALPRAHRSIRGLFKLRNQVIPCVSLQDHLGIEPRGDLSESTMILADFNQQQTAFLVDKVERIHRLSWQEILAVPGLEALSHTPVTALARCDNRLIVMLDFEMILDDVTDQYFRTDAVANPEGAPRERRRILLAEDSPTIREAVGNTLRGSGYTQLQCFENGEQAWDWIQRRWQETQRLDEVADLLIADVEMPQIDGLHLTKRIKEHPELRRIPVLLYSSIVTPDNKKKGAAVGADAQVSKPELAEVVRMADELIGNARREQSAAALQSVAAMAQSSLAVKASPASRPEIAQPLTAPRESQPCATEQNQPPAAGHGEPAEAARSAAARREEPRGQPQQAQAADRGAQADAGPAPQGAKPELWPTFHRELMQHSNRLHELLAQLQAADGEEPRREMRRTLHTVKSAAMVVPVEVLVQCTHRVEDVLEKAAGAWPLATLERYLRWLDEVVSLPEQRETALQAGRELEAQLSAELAD